MRPETTPWGISLNVTSFIAMSGCRSSGAPYAPSTNPALCARSRYLPGPILRSANAPVASVSALRLTPAIAGAMPSSTNVALPIGAPETPFTTVPSTLAWPGGAGACARSNANRIETIRHTSRVFRLRYDGLRYDGLRYDRLRYDDVEQAS